MKIIKKCLRCGRKINKKVDENETMFYCPKCKVWVANKYYEKKVKGGNNEMLTKQQSEYNNNLKKQEKKESKKVEDKPIIKKTIIKQRIENAEKVKDFMTNELKVDNVEQRKILSRCYGIISEEMKK